MLIANLSSLDESAAREIKAKLDADPQGAGKACVCM